MGALIGIMVTTAVVLFVIYIGREEHSIARSPAPRAGASPWASPAPIVQIAGGRRPREPAFGAHPSVNRIAVVRPRSPSVEPPRVCRPTIEAIRARTRWCSAPWAMPDPSYPPHVT